jgi:hypothetical protein
VASSDDNTQGSVISLDVSAPRIEPPRGPDILDGSCPCRRWVLGHVEV